MAKSLESKFLEFTLLCFDFNLMGSSELDRDDRHFIFITLTHFSQRRRFATYSDKDHLPKKQIIFSSSMISGKPSDPERGHY